MHEVEMLQWSSLSSDMNLIENLLSNLSSNVHANGN